MKNLLPGIVFSAISALTFFCSTAFAEQTVKPLADPAATVETRVTDLTRALVSGNAADLKAITLPELSYGHSSGNMENQAQFIESLASGKSDFVEITLHNQQITVSGEVALVRHDLEASINDNGKAGEIYLGVLLVWKIADGEWRLLARQAFRYPAKS